MEVAEGDVVEAVEDGGRHLLGAADADGTLALALEASGDERVGREDAALAGPRGAERAGDAGRAHRPLVVDIRVAVHVPGLGGVGERQRRDAHRAVLVAQDDGRGRLRQLAHEVQSARAQQLPREPDAGAAVVVAGDGDDGDAEAVDELGEDVVEEVHRLGGRHRAVVQVAGDDHGRRPDLGGELDQLLQHVLLVGGEVLVVEQPAEVPVGGVDEPHGGDPTTGPGRRPTPVRRLVRPWRDTIGASAYLPSLQVAYHRRAAVRQTALARRAPSGARGLQRRHPAPLRGGSRCRRGRPRAVPGRRADRRGRTAEPGAARDRAGARAAGRRHALRGHLPAPRGAHPRRRPRAARRPLPHGRDQVGDAAQGVPPPGHRHPGAGSRRGRACRSTVSSVAVIDTDYVYPGRGRLQRPAARDPRRRPGAPAHVAHPRVGARLQRAARRPAAGDPHRHPVPAAVRVPLRRLLRRTGGQDALRPR